MDLPFLRPYGQKTDDTSVTNTSDVGATDPQSTPAMTLDPVTGVPSGMQLNFPEAAKGMLSDIGKYFDQVARNVALAGLKNEDDFLNGINPNTGRPAVTPYDRASTLANFFVNNIGAQSVAGLTTPMRNVLGGGPIRRPWESSLFDNSWPRSINTTPQAGIRRYDPPRGPSERVLALDTPETIGRVNEAVDRGLQMGGADWYETGPLRQTFINILGNEDLGSQNFRKFIDMVAATSPRSDISTNVRNASFYYQNLLNDNTLSKPLQYPYGHWAQDRHLQNSNFIADNGQFDSVQMPKSASFSENLQGNQQPITIDAHNLRLWGMSSGDPRWLVAQHPRIAGRRPRDLFVSGQIDPSDLKPTDFVSAPNPNEYGALEALQQREAANKGLTPAQYQASAWLGAGDDTGLKSPPLPFLQILEDRINKTAIRRNEDPKIQ